jgi:hypothetical protein
MELIAVSSEIHKKHINTLCGQNIEFVSVKRCGICSNPWDLNIKCEFNSFSEGGERKAAEESSAVSTEGSISHSDNDQDEVSCYTNLIQKM